MRRAAHTDANQVEIVKALRAMGAKAVYIKEPCDLLVGFRGTNVLLEIKNGTALRGDAKALKLTVTEQVFHETWPGQITVVSTPAEAMRVVAEAAR